MVVKMEKIKIFIKRFFICYFILLVAAAFSSGIYWSPQAFGIDLVLGIVGSIFMAFSKMKLHV